MSRLYKLAAALACAALWLVPSAVAQAAPDVTPPTAPGQSTFSNVTPFSVTLTTWPVLSICNDIRCLFNRRSRGTCC